MKRTCVLLAFHYPYLRDENFIDLEITYLKNKFERVIVVPTEKPNENPSYILDEGIECYPIQNFSDKTFKLYVLRNLPLNLMFLIKHGKLKKMDLIFLMRACIVYNYLKRLDIGDDVVFYSFWCDYMVLGSLFYKLNTPNKNISVISRAHGYDLYEERNPNKYLPFRKYIVENMDGLFPCSIDGKDYLIKKYGKNDKIETRYLGTSLYKAKRREITPNEKFHIVTCSNIVQIKRLDKLIDALNVLDEKYGKEMKWTCIGTGELLNQIIKQSKEKIKNVEITFEGQLNNNEVLEYYSTVQPDVFINSSDCEGLPVAIMEAMSCGIPVIAPDVGGIKEMIDNGINGILLPENFKVEELANAIDFIKSKANRTLMKSEAIKKWEQCFNAEKNYQEFAKYITKL